MVKRAAQALHNWRGFEAPEERRRKHGQGGVGARRRAWRFPAVVKPSGALPREGVPHFCFDWPDLAGVRAKLAEELSEAVDGRADCRGSERKWSTSWV